MSRSIAPSFALLGFVALALCWAVPGHYPPWVTFQQELCAAIAAVLIALAVRLSGKPLRWPPLAVAAMALAAIPILQWMTGLLPFRSDALLASAYLVGFALCMVAGRSMPGDHVTGLAKAIVAGALLCTVLVLMQWLAVGVPNLFIADLPPGRRPFGNLAQPNHVATVCAMGIACVAYLFEARKVSAVTAALIIGVLLLALLLTQSRTAWLFAALAMISAVALRKRLELRTPLWAVAVLFAVFVGGVLLWSQVNTALQLESVSLESRAHAGIRTVLWPMMLDASLDRPWFGYGWGQSGLAQLNSATDYPPTHWHFSSAHNILLDLAVWAGWPVALAVAVGVCAWFLRTATASRDGTTWALLLAIAAVWLHALVEFPLEYAYFLFPLGLLMGAVDRSGTVGDRHVYSVSVAAAVLLLAMIVPQYIELEQATRVQRFINARVGLAKVNDVERPHAPLLDAEMAFFDLMNEQATANMSADDLQRMKVTVERHPYPGPMFRYATALALNGQGERARAVLATNCRMMKPRACEGSRGAWAELQGRYAALVHIPHP